MTDLAAETWEPQSAALSAESAVHADDAYEIRIAGLNAGGKRWRPSEVRLSPQAQSAGVAATLTPDGAVVRVTLRSSRACKVKWTVTFVALDAPSR
jgi:hypothetical protein